MNIGKVTVLDKKVIATDTRGRTFTHRPGSVRIYRPDGSIKKILTLAQVRALKEKEGKSQP